MLPIYSFSKEDRGHFEQLISAQGFSIKRSILENFFEIKNKEGGVVNAQYSDGGDNDKDGIILTCSCFWIFGRKNQLLFKKVESVIFNAGGAIYYGKDYEAVHNQ